MDIGTVLKTLHEVNLNEFKPLISVSLNRNVFKVEFDAFTKKEASIRDEFIQG
jgi:hypothetical protein